MRDEELAVSEHRWGKGRGVVPVAGIFVGDLGENFIDAALDVCGVGVFDAGFLEGESDMLASAWDARPVEQLIWLGLLAF